MAAGRLREALIAHFGADSVFRDKESIRAGSDWKSEIDRAIGDDTVVLALIGKTWLDARDASGRRRLDDSEDANRSELEHSLKRNIPVVPILVEGGEMPPVERLPEALQGLVRRNALRLRDDDWRSDIGRITQSLESLGISQPSDQTNGRLLRRPLLIGTAAIIVLAVLAWVSLGPKVMATQRLSGTWEITQTFPDNNTQIRGKLLLTKRGWTLGGQLLWDKDHPSGDVFAVTLDGSDVQFKARFPPEHFSTYRGMLNASGDRMEGSGTDGITSANWFATRE
jgi:hypothetical protein